LPLAQLDSEKILDYRARAKTFLKFTKTAIQISAVIFIRISEIEKLRSTSKHFNQGQEEEVEGPFLASTLAGCDILSVDRLPAAKQKSAGA